MKTNVLLLTGFLILLVACNESQYDLDNLVPEEYHKILYINNSGKQQLTLYDTEEDNKYTFSVLKAGSNPDQTASVTIRTLTQEELDNQYSEPENVNYKVIGGNSYILETNRLDFSVSDRYKMVTLFLKPQEVKALINSDPETVWVLPLIAVSETDSVNAEMNKLFLQITGVISPALGFTDTLVNLREYSYGSVSTIAENLMVGLDTDNHWDIECEFEIDEEYVVTYNADHGTLFEILPQGTYTIPESMSLPNGTTNTGIVVSIQGNQLAPGDYMLPIRITNISQFEISSANAVYPLTIRILAPQLSRTGWSAEANTEESSGEGPGNGVAECVLDNDLSTYWHSRWNGGTDALPHELIIDAKEEYVFSQLAMRQRQNEGYMDTRAGEFYISADKSNWVKVGDFTMARTLDTQIFAITPTKGRYFKIKITSGYREPYCSLSEVYAYGLK